MNRRSITDLAFLREQIGTVASALETADLPSFYRAFRASDLPFMLTSHEGDVLGLFHAVFAVLHRFGSISPAAALAVENHYYVTSAIATFPTIDDPALDRRRRSLLALIAERRWLVANTNSKVHGTELGAMGTSARREPGGYRIRGTASYMSLATQGDLLVFITQIEGEGPAVFAIEQLQGNPHIRIGNYLFPSAMIDSDTREISFDDLLIPEEALVVGGRDKRVGLLFAFEMAWHQILIPVLYLGAAARALEEVRQFLRATRTKDDKPLAELDGMVTEAGRLAIAYDGAIAIVREAAAALAAVRRLPRDAPLLERASDLGSAAKYTGTHCAESIVTSARRIIGARVFRGGHPMERLSNEVMFASLGPEVGAVIERRLGRRVLGERSFTDVLGNAVQMGAVASDDRKGD